jgi:peptidoglycan/LPS O-acetylase OafA/YrhL
MRQFASWHVVTSFFFDPPRFVGGALSLRQAACLAPLTTWLVPCLPRGMGNVGVALDVPAGVGALENGAKKQSSVAAGEAVRIERFYRPELDGLRFLAFLAVLVNHCQPQQPLEKFTELWPTVGPWIAAVGETAGFGTDLFFTLSSYLITVLLLREQKACGRLHIGRFYARRILRIWPLYFGFLGFAIFVIPHWVPTMALDHRYQVAFLLFGGNWALAFWGFPHSAAGPLWSVSIEEQFYLVWPFVILLARGRSLRLVAVGMLLISTLTAIVFAAAHVSSNMMGFSTPTRLQGIACGLLAAIVFDSGPWKDRAKEWSVAAAVSLVLLVVLVRYTLSAASGIWTFPVAAFCCLAVLRTVLARGSNSLLARQPFVYLGKVSYGLYVFHLLALSIGTRVLPWAAAEVYYPVRALFALGVSIALATASYYLFERPFLTLKSRFALVPSRPVG